jgi:fluoride exporter
MKNILLVFIGGGLGSLLRFLISRFVVTTIESSFPIATLGINIIGCFLIGVILTLSKAGNINMALTIFLATGFCGGFTTFSTFAYENNTLIEFRQFASVALYISLSVVAGLMATYFGIVLIRKVF